MHVSSASSWPSRAAYVAAGVFLGASGAINLTYGWAKGSDLPSSLTWAAVSVAVAITFALAWPALIRSLDAGRRSAALVATAALILAGSYSITAALGSAAGGRMTAAATETATIAARMRAQGTYERLQADLARLAPARPLIEVEALLDSAKPICRVAVTPTGRQTTCAKPAALLSELARSQERMRLEAAIVQTANMLDAPTVRPANTDAKALARYLAAVGLEASPERLNDLLTLLAVLVVECGGGLALALGLALSEHQRTPAERSLTPAETPNVSAIVQRPIVRPASVSDWLAAHRGCATVSMRRLAADLGCSPSSAHGELRRLALAGTLSVTPGPRGTQIAVCAN